MNHLFSFPGNYAALQAIQSWNFKYQGDTVAMWLVNIIIVNDDKTD